MRIKILIYVVVAMLAAACATGESFPRYRPPVAPVPPPPQQFECCGETICQPGQVPDAPDGEFRCYIFSDSFWTGDTDRWSSAHPW